MLVEVVSLPAIKRTGESARKFASALSLLSMWSALSLRFHAFRAAYSCLVYDSIRYEKRS